MANNSNEECPGKSVGDISLNDARAALSSIAGQELTKKLAFTVLCAGGLTTVVVHSGTYYTPMEDVFVYCAVYCAWVTLCLPWLVQNMDGKVLGLVVGVIFRLFAADIGVVAWSAFRGHRNILQRGLRIKPLFEPSMSWLAEAGYNLRYSVVIAAVVASTVSLLIEQLGKDSEQECDEATRMRTSTTSNSFQRSQISVTHTEVKSKGGEQNHRNNVKSQNVEALDHTLLKDDGRSLGFGMSRRDTEHFQPQDIVENGQGNGLSKPDTKLMFKDSSEKAGYSVSERKKSDRLSGNAKDLRAALDAGSEVETKFQGKNNVHGINKEAQGTVATDAGKMSLSVPRMSASASEKTTRNRGAQRSLAVEKTKDNLARQKVKDNLARQKANSFSGLSQDERKINNGNKEGNFEGNGRGCVAKGKEQWETERGGHADGGEACEHRLEPEHLNKSLRQLMSLKESIMNLD